MSDRDRLAWAQFWSTQKGTGGGCLPQGIAAIDEVQTRVWSAFARALPRAAAVLDLATGDGAVLRKLAASRPDLRLTGVDSAPTLPPPPRGMTFKANSPIEMLPLPARSVDAVTSQFGYEYGDTARAAPEVARVIRPGGALRFIIHHAAGPILKHNQGRREALIWALAGGARLDQARQLARGRAIAPIPTPEAFRASIHEAGRVFPGQSVASEFTTAVLQCLELGRATPPGRTLEALAALEDKARNEIARIDALERAARNEAGIGQLIAGLDGCGIGMDPPQTLSHAGAPDPFAWLISGRRSAT